MIDSCVRRDLLKFAAGAVGTSVLSGGRSVYAQASSSASSVCRPGEKLEIEVFTTTVYVEASINLTRFGGGGSIKIPLQRTEWRIKCTSEPTPPPAPKDKPTSGAYDPSLFLLGMGQFIVEDHQSYFSSANFYFPVSLPSFLGFASDRAQLRFESLLANGSMARMDAALVRNGSGFDIAAPHAVDYWTSTTGAAAVRGSWTVSEVAVQAHSAGSGHYGIGSTYLGHGLAGMSGAIAASRIGGGIGTFRPEALPGR